MSNPERRYAKTHEWVTVDGDIATVGISPFAVEQLTDLVYVELPAPGKSFAVEDQFGVVESVKAVSELFSPVAGEVTEANDAVVADPAILTQDPLGTGWLVKLRLAGGAGLDHLLSQADYDAHCQNEAH